MFKRPNELLRKAYGLPLPEPLRMIFLRAIRNAPASLNGLRFDVSPAGNNFEFDLWYFKSTTETHSLQILCDAVRGRRVFFLDVGANCGVYSLLMAQAAGSGSQVHAFEPNPKMAARLERNIALNGAESDILVHRIGLSDKAGRARLHLRHGNLGEASLVATTLREGRSLEVPTEPLLPWMQKGAGFDLRVLKIDIEEAEELALTPWLESPPAPYDPDVLCMETQHGHVWTAGFLDRIPARGYEVIFEGEGNTIFRKMTSMT